MDWTTICIVITIVGFASPMGISLYQAAGGRGHPKIARRFFFFTVSLLVGVYMVVSKTAPDPKFIANQFEQNKREHLDLKKSIEKIAHQLVTPPSTPPPLSPSPPPQILPTSSRPTVVAYKLRKTEEHASSRKGRINKARSKTHAVSPKAIDSKHVDKGSQNSEPRSAFNSDANLLNSRQETEVRNTQGPAGPATVLSTSTLPIITAPADLPSGNSRQNGDHQESISFETKPVKVCVISSIPELLFKVEPKYSKEARRAKREGTAVLRFVISKDGRPENISSVRTLGLGLDQKAIEAVQKWRFRPADTTDCGPVAYTATTEINFRLL